MSERLWLRLLAQQARSHWLCRAEVRPSPAGQDKDTYKGGLGETLGWAEVRCARRRCCGLIKERRKSSRYAAAAEFVSVWV